MRHNAGHSNVCRCQFEATVFNQELLLYCTLSLYRLRKPGEARKKHTRISLFPDRNVGRLQVVEVICTITQLGQILSEGYLIFKGRKAKFNAPNKIRDFDPVPLVPLVT